MRKSPRWIVHPNKDGRASDGKSMALAALGEVATLSTIIPRKVAATASAAGLFGTIKKKQPLLIARFDGPRKKVYERVVGMYSLPC
jgi:hypothetical protein